MWVSPIFLSCAGTRLGAYLLRGAISLRNLEEGTVAIRLSLARSQE